MSNRSPYSNASSMFPLWSAEVRAPAMHKARGKIRERGSCYSSRCGYHREHWWPWTLTRRMSSGFVQIFETFTGGTWCHLDPNWIRYPSTIKSTQTHDQVGVTLNSSVSSQSYPACSIYNQCSFNWVLTVMSNGRPLTLAIVMWIMSFQ